MILGQSVMADQGGHYVPRVKETATVEAMMSVMRANQHTGLIDPAWMIEASRQASASTTRDENDIYWVSMGPVNMGGRTTSVLYNNQNQNEVYIGSMGGGVFYSWNKGITWHQVGDNLMVSCMAQAEDGTIYVGTGDGVSAVDYNGLSDLSYGNSFIGSGLYMIQNKEMRPVKSTLPTTMNETTEWSFINDVAVDGNKIIVATDNGLRYITADQIGNEDAVWNYAKVDGEDLTGFVYEVKVASDHTVVASVDGALYIGTLDQMVCRSDATGHLNEDNVYDTIVNAGALMDIAIAPSDPNVIYAAAIHTTGNHTRIYVTEDKGATWRIALPNVNTTNGHQLYETRGLFNHGLVVSPDNVDCVYVLGYNLWRLDRSTTDPNGFYLATQLSDGNNDNIFYNTYLHAGINAMAFDPRNAGSAYVATDGGIFKAQADPASLYLTYANCNRGYTSARCFNVAPTKVITSVVAGLMDHGPIYVEGLENTNHTGTAVPLYPANSPSVYGNFDDSYHGGPCAVSTINPEAFFLVTRDGSIQRTETAGVDYDASNFLANQSFSFSGYRMPIALWESCEYENSVDSVQFKCKKDQSAGDVVKCFSNNSRFPFDFTVPYDMHYNADHPEFSDSIMVKDPIATKFYVADGSSVYYTRDALLFGKGSAWFKLATTGGVSSCITVSPDGDVVLVGTRNGRLIRITNMLAAVDSATCVPTSEDFAPVVSVFELPVNGQCVTSVSMSKDNKKAIITLGNYGNDNYVLYCKNMLDENPEFLEKQNNLPKMPVYASVIDITTGDILLGTEHGVYRTTNINATPTWSLVDTHMGDVPVMELKQQTMYFETQYVPMIMDTIVVYEPYPGVNNQGVIYAATYGRGLFRCDAYRLNSGNNVPEVPAVAAKTVEMYPNPVRDAAKLSFDLSQRATVSYQVFDMTGRLVKVEQLGNFAEGNHEVSVSMEGLASGSYLLRLEAGANTSSVKFMVY